MVIYSDGQPVMGKAAEIKALRVRYGLATVDGSTFQENTQAQRGTTKFGRHVAESEFGVLQAIVFPGINILWIGCVLLALGSGMAVWQRVRRTRSKTT